MKTTCDLGVQIYYLINKSVHFAIVIFVISLRPNKNLHGDEIFVFNLLSIYISYPITGLLKLLPLRDCHSRYF